MIEVVFFDAGDTILRPHPSFAELFATVCRDEGRAVDAEEVQSIQNRIAPHLIDLAPVEGEEAISYLGSSASEEESRRFWGYLYRRFLAELNIEDDSLANRLLDVFSHSGSYKLFDDVLPTFGKLRAAGLSLGLISNFEGWLEELLVELEVGHLFDTRVISGVDGVEKPDPAIYELALRRAGVAASAALHVGDSPVMDVEPARSVGLQVVLLDRMNRYEGVKCPKIASLEELPHFVLKH